MAALQDAPGRRFVPAGWRDPRLLVGIALVIASVFGVVLLVQSLERTQPVYAAARDVGTGENITIDDLSVVQVRLGDAAAGYLSADAEPQRPLRALSALRQGELIPLRALGHQDEERRPVAIRLEGPPPPGVNVGGLVDVYASDATTMSQTQPPPRLVLRGVEVLAVSGVDGGLGSGQSTEVQLLVPPQDVAAAVAARAAGRLDVVGGASAP